MLAVIYLIFNEGWGGGRLDLSIAAALRTSRKIVLGTSGVLGVCSRRGEDVVAVVEGWQWLLLAG